jgi:PKD repeat protein
MDSSGNLIWVKQFGGSSMDQSEGNGIAVDDSGNVFTTGTILYGGADFDPGPENYYLASTGEMDVFISKLNSDGDFVWAKRFGGARRDIGNSITSDRNGNLFLTGTFIGQVDFDPGVTNFLLTSATQMESDIFICKFQNNGEFKWAGRIGGGSSDVGLDITTDPFGNVFTTGYFYATTDFDPGEGVYTLSGGSKNAFISKLSNDGNFIWARHFYGRSNIAYSIASDKFGNVYTTGEFNATLAEPTDFDPGPEVYPLYLTNNAADIFVAKLDSAGLFICAGAIGGPASVIVNRGLGIAVDEDENIFYTGQYTATPDFDPGAGNFYMSTTSSSMDDEDIFVSKLGTPKTQTPLKPSAGFETQFRKICRNSCIAYSDNSLNASQWEWHFQGAIPTSSSDRNPQPVCYPDTGSFEVMLIVTNEDGADTLIQEKYISILPDAGAGNIVSENAIICIGESALINLENHSGPIQWQVSTDGISFQQMNWSESSLTLDSVIADNWLRVLTVNEFCPDTSEIYKLTAIPNPTAEFTISGGDFNREFRAAQDTSQGVVYSWDFGDETFSNQQNPQHLFLSAGSFAVCLTVYSELNCSAETCQEIQTGITSIHSISNPSANIQLSYYGGNVLIRLAGIETGIHQLVLFDLSGSMVYSGSIHVEEKGIVDMELPRFIVPGFYLVSIQTQTTQLTIPLIVN